MIKGKKGSVPFLLLGSEKFRGQIEDLLGVKIGYSKRGRPKPS